jgi:hypothetical protein
LVPLRTPHHGSTAGMPEKSSVPQGKLPSFSKRVRSVSSYGQSHPRARRARGRHSPLASVHGEFLEELYYEKSQSVIRRTRNRHVWPVGSTSTGSEWARVLADQIGRTQGLAMVVENRPGASQDIGTEAVSRAAPDGNTLLLTSPALVMTKHVHPSLAFDPLTSFEPICSLVRASAVVAVNSASPYRSLSDLLAAARARPGTLTIGAFGPVTPTHIVEESLKLIAHVDWTFVPFSGDAPAVTALLGGHVTAIVATYSAVMEQVASRRLRVLAVTGREREAALPDVPTIAESTAGAQGIQATRILTLLVGLACWRRHIRHRIS